MKRDYRKEALQSWLYNDEATNKKTFGAAAAREIAAIRWYLQDRPTPFKITGQEDTVKFIRSVIALNSYESFLVIYLTRSNEVIRHEITNIGAANKTVFDLQRIIKNALNCNAQGLIIAHNHPSGSTAASHNDREMTSQMQQACKLFDIKLIDSLIVTTNGFYSLLHNIF